MGTWVVEEILAYGTRLRSTHCREFIDKIKEQGQTVRRSESIWTENIQKYKQTETRTDKSSIRQFSSERLTEISNISLYNFVLIHEDNI